MTAFLNIGSLVLGLLAWVFACLAIKGGISRRKYILSTASFSFCSLSLLGQLLEVGNRVNQNDFSAIADTIRAVIIASCVMVVVTIVLNVVALMRAGSR